MLIIITRSDDASVNLLEPFIESQVVRINVDKSDEWAFSYTDGVWQVKDSSHTHNLGPNTKCWWWKVYFDPEDGDTYRNAEVEYIVREIYAQSSRVGTLVGNSPSFHQRLGKLAILDIARAHLRAPYTSCVFNTGLSPIGDAVVKSLASSAFANSRVLYTTRVPLSALDTVGHPWLAQRFIDSPLDVTTYVVGSMIFTYSRTRTTGKTIDWRKEQLEDLERKAWFPDPLSERETKSVLSIAQDLGIEWGRFDFLRDHNGELWFLEFNANGQFGFLDELDETGLISAIANYLSKKLG